MSEKRNNDQKNNLMVFIRPQIIDTKEQIDKLTKEQQDIWKDSRRFPNSFRYEVDEALDLFNLECNEDGEACMRCCEF